MKTFQSQLQYKRSIWSGRGAFERIHNQADQKITSENEVVKSSSKDTSEQIMTHQ